jgi:hypothetical protein
MAVQPRPDANRFLRQLTVPRNHCANVLHSAMQPRYSGDMWAALPDTVHCCSRHGVVAARLSSQRPGSVITVSKTFIPLLGQLGSEDASFISFETSLTGRPTTQHHWRSPESSATPLWAPRISHSNFVPSVSVDLIANSKCWAARAQRLSCYQLASTTPWLHVASNLVTTVHGFRLTAGSTISLRILIRYVVRNWLFRGTSRRHMWLWGKKHTCIRKAGLDGRFTSRT